MTTTELFRKARRNIEAKKGDFTLFALCRRPDALFNMWDLVAAAPWLKGGEYESRRELVRLLAKAIGTRSFLQLSRVAVVDEDQPVVKFMVKSLPVEGDNVRGATGTDLYPLGLEQAIVFRAKENRARRNGSPHKSSTKVRAKAALVRKAA